MIKYYDRYNNDNSDDNSPIKVIFLKSNPCQVIQIEELSHLSPLDTTVTLEKIKLITWGADVVIGNDLYNPSNTITLDINSFQEIEPLLPNWLSKHIGKQYTLSNIVAKIINENFNEHIKEANIHLSVKMQAQFKDILYALLTQDFNLDIPPADKKLLMTAFQDQDLRNAQDISNNPIANEHFFSNQYAQAVQSLPKEYGNNNISNANLIKLPNKLEQILKNQPYFKFLETLTQGLTTEFAKCESSNDIKTYEIYYLLGVYFAYLSSTNGLGYDLAGDNKCFQRFRLYAAICLNQCVMSAEDNLSDSEKLKICQEIRKILTTSECIGQIANRLYGKYSIINYFTKRLKEILGIKLL